MEENKDKILSKAISLFSKKGYDAVGVQEICTESGITKPTLYYYFGSKKGILEAVRETFGQPLLKKLTNASFYQHDFIKGLTQILKTEIEYALENKDFYTLHASFLHSPKESESNEVYGSLAKEIKKTYEEFFLLSQNEFGNMRGKESLYALLFHNTTVQTALSVLEGTIKYDDETVYRIIHSFVYGVAS